MRACRLPSACAGSSIRLIHVKNFIPKRKKKFLFSDLYIIRKGVRVVPLFVIPRNEGSLVSLACTSILRQEGFLVNSEYQRMDRLKRVIDLRWPVPFIRCNQHHQQFGRLIGRVAPCMGGLVGKHQCIPGLELVFIIQY